MYGTIIYIFTCCEFTVRGAPMWPQGGLWPSDFSKKSPVGFHILNQLCLMVAAQRGTTDAASSILCALEHRFRARWFQEPQQYKANPGYIIKASSTTLRCHCRTLFIRTWNRNPKGEIFRNVLETRNPRFSSFSLQRNTCTTHCNIIQHSATCCNTVTHCSTLPKTATRIMYSVLIDFVWD